jgi:hypothetical protein
LVHKAKSAVRSKRPATNTEPTGEHGHKQNAPKEPDYRRDEDPHKRQTLATLSARTGLTSSNQ